jgi:hypothetical protein
MATDLRDQILDLMERGVRPVSAAEAASQARCQPAPVRRRSTGKRTTITVVASLTAAACAAAVVATQAGGGAGPASRRPALATDAYVLHLAAASRIALAQAGRAEIVTRQTQGGVFQGTGTDDITFSGRNWNDSFSEILPASAGQPATRQSAINRVVDGQAYDYFVAAHGLAWYHEVGSDAIESMAIPDPRTLLGELAPGARFVLAGYSTMDGVRLEHLRATRLTGLPAIQLGNATPQGRLTALNIWADTSGVVHRMTLTTSQTVAVGMLNSRTLLRQMRADPASHRAKLAAVRRWVEKESKLLKGHGLIKIELGSGKSGMTLQTQVTTMTVSFLDIGQPQAITVPAHAYLTHGLG